MVLHIPCSTGYRSAALHEGVTAMATGRTSNDHNAAHPKSVVHNEITTTAASGHVVQAGTIIGDVHLHAATPAVPAVARGTTAVHQPRQRTGPPQPRAGQRRGIGGS
jgi:hypothetical protein